MSIESANILHKKRNIHYWNLIIYISYKILLNFINKTEWLLAGPFGLTNYWGSAYEMTYFCILMLGGILGMLAFLVPIVYIFVKKLVFYRKTSPIVKGVFEGVLVYLIIAYVEGALWLPPTAINLWMVLSIGYKTCLYKKETEKLW